MSWEKLMDSPLRVAPSLSPKLVAREQILYTGLVEINKPGCTWTDASPHIHQRISKMNPTGGSSPAQSK